MFSQNNKISIRQIKILIILNLFSNTSLILPRLASEIAAEDGWIIVIGGAIVSLVYVWVITSLVKLFPSQDILSYTELIFSRPVAVVIGVVFCIKLVILAGLEIRVFFGELVKQTLLRDTPIEVIVITMLFFVVAYLTRKGFEARARMAELLIFVIIIPLVLIFFICYTGYRNLSYFTYFYDGYENFCLWEFNDVYDLFRS